MIHASQASFISLFPFFSPEHEIQIEITQTELPRNMLLGYQTYRSSIQTFARRALSTTVTSDGEGVAATVQLYQYAICPFCNKAKALLDYARVPYQSIEVNPLNKAEIKWYVWQRWLWM